MRSCNEHIKYREQAGMSKAVFIDKDGTLIPNIPFNSNPDLITLSEDCTSGLKALQNRGYELIMITNQSGIAHNYFSEREFLSVLDKIRDLLSFKGINLKGAEYCPHYPLGQNSRYAVNCLCRKPLPGMLYNAAKKYELSLPDSWMIGDILDDVEAGHRAGCKSILIDNGNETEWISGRFRKPDLIASTVNHAAEMILEHEFYENRLV
jgi:D-glycero-D-manno-heptose 1,7-bisphosphate phosphatase